ncbi:MAG: ABC transporter permease [Pleurocapsa minor GSE-CHR-MK-17-07R]|jgi:NitT/TauT family transport system permease protein|nr:ABC transporter permease [Pleurocapsa minor GSE-CHR-MK 17-07R]
MLDDALNRSAMERESTGSASTSHSFTQAQQSDLEAAAPSLLTVPADEIIEYENRSLGRDFLAITVIFLLAAAYHIQNPLLLTLQFGRSWRSATLQPVIIILLFITCAALIRASLAGERGQPKPAGLDRTVRLVAAGILIAFCVFVGVSQFARFNVISAVSGIETSLMFEQVRDDTDPALLAALSNAASLSGIFEYAAIGAIIALWQPWTRLGTYRRTGRKQFAAIVVGVTVVVAWEVLINITGTQEFLLPRPSVIFGAFMDGYPRLISAAWVTFQNAFWGFALGCGLGVLTGMVSARFLSFSRALLPVAIAVNAVPIIALAPIFNNWFGALNPFSKVAIVAVMTYFPAMISTVRGLTSVDTLSLELMRSYAASQLEIFRKARLPNALPFIFSALKVGTTLATIGAIVSEYFGGSTAGLGFRIRDDAGLFKYPDAWAAIVMASLFGILFYLVVSAVERALLHWHVSFREK